MSAYVVSNATLNILVTALCKGTAADPQLVGKTLLEENNRSVNYRYKLKARAGKYVHQNREATPVQILKLCDNYEYQSCERPSWSNSTARRLIDQLRRKAIRLLPGYQEAAWHID